MSQSNDLISRTDNPYVSSYSRYFKITSVSIYEQYTAVQIMMENWEYNQIFSFNSDSYIQDPNDPYNTYRIVLFADNELDKNYTWGNTGERNYITLIFQRLAPGVKKINIIINPSEEAQYKVSWTGVTINNPDNHPRTIWTEQSLKNDWESNERCDAIEGIYEILVSMDGSKYKLALKKIEGSYKLIYLSGAVMRTWKVGDIKAELEETATPFLFKVKWYMGNKAPSEDLYITFEQGVMKTIWTDGRDNNTYIKLYPIATSSSNNSGAAISGSGFALSSSGFIVTNHHVIDGIHDLSVRGISGDFHTKYRAQVYYSDERNDLAIIKIADPNFTSLGQIPYSIKTSMSPVGEGIFVLGYPLLSTMGTEIKLTNGIISSKAGYQGDIASYQISAAVQPGNSGGPLFDNSGNLIGVVNAKLINGENVSYAIKSMYLQNLIEVSGITSEFQAVNKLYSKTLPEQVEAIKNFVYIIEGIND